MVIPSKKIMLIIGLVMVGVVMFSGLVTAEDNVRIGISQIVEHPALDAAREGFISGLAESGFKAGENVEFIEENAQGDFATAQSIAQKFRNDNLDLILAIATPCAQATANIIEDTPILITAVTDPVSAGLAESLESSGRNITGTTDMNPVRDQFALIKQFLPDVNKVGVLYNSGEVNSEVQVKIAKEVGKDMDIEIKEGTVTNTSEVQLAASSLVDKVDAFYLPTDNVVASAIPSILQVANQENVPVFASESGMVDQGAVATKGIDYFELGRKTGKKAAEVLNGKKPSEIAIEGSDEFNVTINKTACEKLGLEIPEELLKDEAAQVIE